MYKTKKIPRVAIFQVIQPHYHRDDALEHMKEAVSLVHTFGGRVVYKDVQHRVNPHPGTYLGGGKLKQLQKLVKEKKLDLVIINDFLKAGTQFRILKSLWDINPQIEVWDRVTLILEIFEKNAASTIAKLQIELARIEHEGPKIYGLGKDRLSRQGGGIGTRGKGETNIEVEKRIIKDRKSKLKKQLKKLLKQKQNRIQRRRQQGIGPVALVGYTSAGKTTLFNTLTGKQKKQSKKLFTTLDTVVGKMKTPDQRMPILISDTIGFIKNLPPKLIDAFKSTLLESLESKLILHVIDVTDPLIEDKVFVVDEIIHELGAGQPVWMVFNKVDQASQEQLKKIKKRYANEKQVFFVSAISKAEVKSLKQSITQELIHT